MKSNLFREKNMKKVASPEQLNDYVKVTNPGIWMVLISIIFLLIGVSVWGIFGNLNTVICVGAECRDGLLTCYIQAKDIANVKKGMRVVVDDSEYELISVSDQSIPNEKSTKGDVLNASNTTGEFYIAQADAGLEDGIYEAAIIIESIHPMEFILN